MSTIRQGWSISKEFQHKGHSVEIARDRSCYGLTYIVSIDGDYAGDVNNTMSVAIDQAKAAINRLETV